MKVTRQDILDMVNEQGRTLWDQAVELCAKAAESVPVADRNPMLVRNEIADRIRKLSYAVTPAPADCAREGKSDG